MKLLTYEHDKQTRFGVVVQDNYVLDLNKAFSEYLKDSQTQSSKSTAENEFSMISYINSSENFTQIFNNIFEWYSIKYPLLRPNEFVKLLSSIKILPPLDNPNKLLCIGLNYKDHCREHNFPVPEKPLIFVKYPTSIIGHDGVVNLPNDLSEQVDYEAELAVIIKKKCKNITITEAKSSIAGYSIINDISARDIQFSDVQWARGKSFDTFCPFGPYLVTPDEIGDPQNLKIRCWLNDEVMQDSNTHEMIFNVYEIISFASKHSTLLPGDIIATGTPDGVGSGRKPPIYLKHGDITKVEIEKIGLLKNSYFNAV